MIRVILRHVFLSKCCYVSIPTLKQDVKLIGKPAVITKVTEPLVSIQPFIPFADLWDSGVIHPKIANSLTILLVFT